MSKHRVVVVGSGFGGLAAVQALAGADVEVTLIDRRNHHLFQPLLYQVATASLSTSEIAWPIRHILRNRSEVTTLLATVTGVDAAGKAVVLEDGSRVAYDSLVLATGARHAYFGSLRFQRRGVLLLVASLLAALGCFQTAAALDRAEVAFDHGVAGGGELLGAQHRRADAAADPRERLGDAAELAGGGRGGLRGGGGCGRGRRGGRGGYGRRGRGGRGDGCGRKYGRAADFLNFNLIGLAIYGDRELAHDISS